MNLIYERNYLCWGLVGCPVTTYRLIPDEVRMLSQPYKSIIGRSAVQFVFSAPLCQDMGIILLGEREDD